MTYTYPEKTQIFTLTFAEAMACHAYGGNFVSVRIDPESICIALMFSEPDSLMRSLSITVGYFSKSEELFGERGENGGNRRPPRLYVRSGDRLDFPDKVTRQTSVVWVLQESH